MHVCNLLLVLAASSAMAVDVENAAVGADENEGASYSFIPTGDWRFMLPFRTHVNGFVHNAQKSVWAVNYHETSNYDGVDLVIENGRDIFVVPNMWSIISTDVLTKNIVDKVPDRVHFQVSQINDHDLRCQLIGRTGDASTDRLFSVHVDIVNQEPVFRVAP